jgi:hypothetical protein
MNKQDLINSIIEKLQECNDVELLYLIQSLLNLES